MKKTLLKIHEDVPFDHYDRALKSNPLQKFWHKRRFSELKKYAATSGTLLDVGCHSALFTKKLFKGEKVKVYGVDISNEAISYARKRIPKGHFYTCDAKSMPFSNQFFDNVYCLEMLEHTNNPKKVLGEICRVTKKSGSLFILIPTDSLLFKVIWTFWNLLNPVWKHAHVQSFNEKSLSKLLKASGFRTVSSKMFLLNMLLLVKAEKV